jgi:hypothetical protein
MDSHQPRHALAADRHALIDQLGSHPWHAVGLMRVSVHLTDALGEYSIG